MECLRDKFLLLIYKKNYFTLLPKLIDYLIDQEKGGCCLAEEVEGLFPHCLPAGSGWQPFI